VRDKLRVLKSPAPEKPIEEVDPRLRLGQLFRRFRVKSGRSLRETARALSASVENIVVLGEIERGRRPATSEQIQDFCDFIGVGTVAFFDAARDYHRSVWADNERQMQVVEQSFKVASTGSIYDQQELVLALRNAVNVMDLASEILTRCARILRSEEASARDGELAGSAALSLDSGAHFARRVLNSPLQRPFADEPPDWCDADIEADDEE